MSLHTQRLIARALVATLVSALVSALVANPLSAQPKTELENVAAFARLYGVARWFYPSDAAAALDWNRFAVDGVRRVRGARTSAELNTTLAQLFTPLGPGFEIGATLPPARPVGARDPELVAWHHRGPGFSDLVSAYSSRRLNRITPAPRTQQSATSVLSQTIAADSLRGRAIRMRGLARVANPDAEGWAGLWLRVDRPGQTVGFFDNMQDRPVRDTTWREYVIEGTIAADATLIAFGALGVGDISVDVDAIELAVRAIDGTWTPLVVRDASFEDDQLTALRAAWTQSSPFSRITTGAPQGTRFVRIPPAPSARATSTAPARAADSLETPIAGAVSEFALTRGLRARVPLSLTDADARTESPALASLRTALAAVSPSAAGRDGIDVRLADIVVAWSVFRHFYPYWGDVAIDWDARLLPQLETALAATSTREAHLEAVRLLVAELNDGHGSVRDLTSPTRSALLPLELRILSNRLVVTASREAAVPVGSVITQIDGTPAQTLVLAETRLASGTPQWKRTRAEGALQLCRVDVAVALTIEPPTGPARDVSVPCTRSNTRVSETRPDSIAELEPGVWYVDLTRVLAAQLRPMLPALAKARGVVFDVRGYPTDAGAAVLPHLMRAPEAETDRWMHVPRFAQPFAVVAGWTDLTWSLRPASPRIAGQRVFLTDGRAISYAESVMGYVRDYQLGTIIGGTTAGANGNIATFNVPGGFSLVFTGMRVTRHDGRTAYHVAGVSPDIPLEPSLESIRAGRDELLARALMVLRIQP